MSANEVTYTQSSSAGDAAAYSVLLLDSLLRVQMIANPGKLAMNQNQSYGIQ